MTSNVNINQECDKLNHVSFAMKPQKIKRQNVKKKKKNSVNKEHTTLKIKQE